ncbi:MAG: type II toxin-antitoxin system prevent-host-death family antitoxin [Desulfobacterales bacterium]|jgi:prevent-host-death family protein|nr:type II toxin-antitoxin system prevent-host-death family antitoxin [Desulfobacterales bacterium]
MRNTRVGIRDAKIHLSRYLKLVQEGREVVITDHGRPVGKIVAVDAGDLPLQDRIDRLVAQGVLEPAAGDRLRKLPPALPVPTNAAQRMLQEDRDA